VQDVNWVALTIFVLLFGFITWLGFAAANWRKGDLDQLHEWGLGGRRFGTIVTWPTYPLVIGGYTFPGYTALYTVILNLLVAIVLTPVFNAMNTRRAPVDETVTADYHA